MGAMEVKPTEDIADPKITPKMKFFISDKANRSSGGMLLR
jgi:hypothetical protein